VKYLHDILTEWPSERRKLTLGSLICLPSQKQSTVNIWMDTLCIPPHATADRIPDFANVKSLAIASMNIIYAESFATLVLDAELQPKCGPTIRNATLPAYLHCCGWNTRAWTLQEGGLPKRTIFALTNKIWEPPVFSWTISDPWHRRYPPPSPTEAILIDHYLAKRLGTWGKERRWVNDGANLYTKTWNSLLQRSSGEAADIPAILANILGISSYKVLQQPTDSQRIGVTIRRQSAFPIGILYNTGPRVQASRYAASLDLVPRKQKHWK
jgi:hypothetical protein